METNNKLREALKMCVDELCARCRDLAKAQGDPMPCLNGCEPVRKAKAALSTPSRNCDVGTAEEQVARYHAFCAKMMKQNNHCCGPCPCHEFINGEAQSCTLLWAQMPYKEGCAK